MMDIKVKTIVDDGEFLNVRGVCGTCFFINKKYINKNIPKQGDTITLHFVNGYGTQIRGMDINAKKLYYLTEEEIQQEFDEWLKGVKDKRRRNFIKIEPILNEIFSLLPPLIQQRILMFRHFMPDFRVEGEFYELVPVFLGYKMYRLCYDDDIAVFSKKVLEFDHIKYAKSHRLLKNFEFSWNQVNFAQAFAGAVYTDKALLKQNVFDVKELKGARVMSFPNCSAPLEGCFCSPIKKHIVEYAEQTAKE